MRHGPRDEPAEKDATCAYRELDGGAAVLYDLDNPRAWVRSDVTVGIER